MVRSLLVFAFLPRTFVFCALDACFVLRQTFTIYPANVERGETLFFLHRNTDLWQHQINLECAQGETQYLVPLVASITKNLGCRR